MEHDAGLAAGLAARGVAWPAPLHYIAEIGSTNQALRGSKDQPWTTLRAGSQTAGRGRQGARWVSPPGNLYLSILLPCGGIEPDRTPLISLASGICVCEALEEWGVGARLKWPNDVWLDGRKLAGLLVEATSSGRGLESLVLGIGVNVSRAPEGTDPPAACVGDVAGAAGRDAPAAAEVAAALLVRIRGWYHRAAAGPAEHVTSEFQRRALDWWGRVVRVTQGEREVRGVARGLDSRGALLIEVEGRITAVLAGDARALRPGE